MDTPTPDPQCLFQKFETVAANHGRLRGSAGHEKQIQPSASYSRPIFQTSDTRASQENYTAKDIILCFLGTSICSKNNDLRPRQKFPIRGIEKLNKRNHHRQRTSHEHRESSTNRCLVGTENKHTYETTWTLTRRTGLSYSQ